MDTNQPNTGSTLDQEHAEALKRMGNRIDQDILAELVKEPEPEKVDEKAPETPPAPVAEPVAPVAPTVEAPATEPAQPAVAPVDSAPEAQPNRPTAFVPVGKYTHEKKEWKRENDELKAQLAALTAAGTGTPAQAVESVQAFADKYNMEPEFVNDLMELTKKGVGTPEHNEVLAQLVQQQQQQADIAAYESEFATDAAPVLQRMYPNATPEQLAAAKAAIWEPSHTEANASVKLRHLLVDITDILDPIFKTAAAPAQAEAPATPLPDMPGMESRKPGAARPDRMTSADFKGAKDFSALDQMDPSVSKEIVKNLDPDTYSNYLAYTRGNKGVTVMRNGRKIELK